MREDGRCFPLVLFKVFMRKISPFCLIIWLVLFAQNIIAQSADIIVINANIITAVKKGDRKQAMAIKDGIIIFTGTNKEILQYKTSSTNIIDVKGSTIIPGLNDVHLHPTPETAFPDPDHSIRLDTVTSLNSLLTLIARKAAITPKGMLIRGRGYNESKLGGQPLRDILDKGSTDHPVYITHASGHMSAANSYLLTINNITKATTDPAGGAFDRYPDGTPDGICKESAQSNLTKNKSIVPFPAKTKEEETNGYRKYFSNLLSFGITSVGDAGTDTNRLKIYQTLAQEQFPMRFNIMIVDRLLPEMEGGDAHHETDEWKALSYFNDESNKESDCDCVSECNDSLPLLLLLITAKL